MTITDECARGDHPNCDYWPGCTCPCHTARVCPPAGPADG